MFGTVDTAQGKACAMLCIDADRPTEYMIQTWGKDMPSMAILADAEEKADGVHLKGRWLFRSLENGALHLPHLNDDEVARVQGMRARLTRMDDGALSGTWTAIDGKQGGLSFSDPPVAASFEPYQCKDWTDFKRWASEVRTEHSAGLYRGHGNSAYRLTTTLHRAGRHRLDRYCAEPLVQFHAEAEAVLGMRFNMSDGSDYATVLGLAQHHGLPTPLLDWTTSPYVAAFFAFADALDSPAAQSPVAKVRIYALTKEFVSRTSPVVVVLPVAPAYVASLSIAPRHNVRLRAQQGHFLVTNVADVEAWIRQMEVDLNARYLYAADVPASCAREALEDLSFMGLTAATMFPGLDGVGKTIRHAMTFKAPPIPPAGIAAAMRPSGADPAEAVLPTGPQPA